MSKKPTILFLSRARLDGFYAGIINEIKDSYNVVVFLDEESGNVFDSIPGISVVRNKTNDELAELIEQDNGELSELAIKIEKELGINAYSMNSNYVLYEKFVGRYSGQLTHRFLNVNLEKVFPLKFELLNNIIKDYNVEYCFYDCIDTIESYIIAAMARKGMIKQFFTQILVSAAGDLRMRLASGINSRSPYLEYVYSNNLASDEAYDWARRAVEISSKDAAPTGYDEANRKKAHFFQKYGRKDILNRLVRTVRGESLRPVLTRLYNRHFSAKNFSSEIGNKRNIAVFLQLVPEAGLMSELPAYANQEITIERMSIFAKAGYNILVKEHPACFGNHSPRFYKELNLLSNVVLLPPSYPTRDILLKSEAVVVGTGTTVGLEAMLLGVPLITYGRPYYDISKNVTNIIHPEDVWDHLPDIPFDNDDRLRFFASLYEASYEYPPYVSDEEYEKGIGAAPVIGAALRKEIALYEDMILP